MREEEKAQSQEMRQELELMKDQMKRMTEMLIAMQKEKAIAECSEPNNPTSSFCFTNIPPYTPELIPQVMNSQSNINDHSKLPIHEFEKYDGSSCPKIHLEMYHRKMLAHINEEEFLVHYFPNSLTSSAARWYMQLGNTQIRKWKDLVDLFLTQFKYNLGVVPEHPNLRKVEKQSRDFEGCVYESQQTTAHTQQLLTLEDSTPMFINNLPSPKHAWTVGKASANNSEGLEHGRVVDVATSFKPHPMVHTHRQTFTKLPTTRHHHINTGTPRLNVPQVALGSNVRPISRCERAKDKKASRYGPRQSPYDPIPMSYAQLYPRLLESRLVAPMPVKPLEAPFPEWYDPNAWCEYHANGVGHTIENCHLFKRKVQALMSVGWLKFEDRDGASNANQNSLLNHDGN